MRQKSRAWEPMRPAVPYMTAEAREAMVANLRAAGVPQDVIEDAMKPQETWRNWKYVATVARDSDGYVAHISLRRDDRGAVHDWRDLQRIKNEIAGPEAEAIELYPAESRLVDTANQYHLWCYPPGTILPVGSNERMVSGPELTVGTKAQQREFE